MLWKVLVGLFITVGVGIAILSVYKASVDGLMQKVGLVGGDFGAAVFQEKMSQTVAQINKSLACDLPTRMRGAVRFMLSDDQEQGQLAFQLGNERIQCGAKILSRGDTEIGTYEVLKGMGYLKQGYQFIQDRMVVDTRVCTGLPDESTQRIVTGILDSTNGKVYQLIWSEWQGVQEMALTVDQVCLDQRMKTR